jgi:hypothetical protein
MNSVSVSLSKLHATFHIRQDPYFYCPYVTSDVVGSEFTSQSAIHHFGPFPIL